MEEAFFSCFFDREKDNQTFEKSGMLAAKGKVSRILGRVCGRGAAHGEVRRGQALRSRRKLPEYPEATRASDFLCVGGGGEGSLEEFGELELGELEEGAWILRRRTRVWGLERRRQGAGGFKGYRLMPPTPRNVEVQLVI